MSTTPEFFRHHRHASPGVHRARVPAGRRAACDPSTTPSMRRECQEHRLNAGSIQGAHSVVVAGRQGTRGPATRRSAAALRPRSDPFSHLRPRSNRIRTGCCVDPLRPRANLGGTGNAVILRDQQRPIGDPTVAASARLLGSALGHTTRYAASASAPLAFPSAAFDAHALTVRPCCGTDRPVTTRQNDHSPAERSPDHRGPDGTKETVRRALGVAGGSAPRGVGAARTKEPGRRRSPRRSRTQPAHN